MSVEGQCYADRDAVVVVPSWGVVLQWQGVQCVACPPPLRAAATQKNGLSDVYMTRDGWFVDEQRLERAGQDGIDRGLQEALAGTGRQAPHLTALPLFPLTRA